MCLKRASWSATCATGIASFTRLQFSFNENSFCCFHFPSSRFFHAAINSVIAHVMLNMPHFVFLFFLPSFLLPIENEWKFLASKSIKFKLFNIFFTYILANCNSVFGKMSNVRSRRDQPTNTLHFSNCCEYVSWDYFWRNNCTSFLIWTTRFKKSQILTWNSLSMSLQCDNIYKQSHKRHQSYAAGWLLK